MAGIIATNDPGKAKGRFGFQLCPQLAATSLPFHVQFDTEEVKNIPESFASERITGGKMRGPDFPGLAPAGGPFTVELDPESVFPFIAVAQDAGMVVEGPSGVFTHTLSPLQTAIDFASRHITLEIHRDDDQPQRTVDCVAAEINITGETGAVLKCTITLVAGWADYWGDAELRGPTPADAPASVIGLDKESDWRALTGPLTIRAEEIIPAVGSVPLTTKVVVKRGFEAVLTGTWTVSAGTNAFTGSGGAALTELKSGDYIDAHNELLQVDVVTDDDTFTTVANHVAGLAGATLVETFGPVESTLPRWTHLTKGNVQYGEIFDSRTGVRIGDRANGNRVEMFFDAEGLTEPPTVTLTGTTTHTISADTLAGVGTDFVNELSVGQVVLLGDSIEHRIKSIADATNATTVQVRVDATAAGAALTVPPHWDVAQQRPDFVVAATLAPILNVINARVIFDSSPFQVTTFNVVITNPVTADFAVGTRRAVGVRSQGLRTINVNFDRAKLDNEIMIGMEQGGLFRFEALAEGAKDIAGSDPLTEYEIRFLAPTCRHTGSRGTIVSPTENVEAVTSSAGQDAEAGTPDLEITAVNTIDAAAITPP